MAGNFRGVQIFMDLPSILIHILNYHIPCIPQKTLEYFQLRLFSSADLFLKSSKVFKVTISAAQQRVPQTWLIAGMNGERY